MKNLQSLLILFSLFGLVACGGAGSNSAPPPTGPVSATLNFDIKTFRFEWTDISGATHYKLLEDPDGASSGASVFTQVGSDIPQGTQSFDHNVALYKRLNASYILQSCNASGCADAETFAISDTLVDAIGYFKADITGAGDGFGYAVSLSGIVVQT